MTRYAELAALARPALITAAMRSSLMTYAELGRAIGLSGIELRNHMRHVLDQVADDCDAAGEPSLAVLVVNARIGEPGAGFRPGAKTWHAEARACFERWRS